jgi:hypothetical protein
MTRRAGLAVCALLWTHATAAFAQTSWGIGVLANGAIVFCDPGRSTVWQVDRGGERTAVLTGVTCHAIVTAPDGTVYGESTPSDVTATRGVGLWHLGADGLRPWPMPPTLAPTPDVWLVTAAEGSQYSWNGTGDGSPQSEIVQRQASGASLVVAGGSRGQQDGVGRDARFNNVDGLAIAPDGSLVIADSGNIRRMSPLYTVRTEAVGVITDSRQGLTGIPGLWGRQLGVATDATGAAVVVDPEARHIVRIDRAGRATPIWEPAGFPERVSGGRWGWRPAGVALVGRTYYVVDAWMGPTLIADLVGSPRLSRVDENGGVTRIAAITNRTVQAATAAFLLVLLSLGWKSLRARRKN